MDMMGGGGGGEGAGTGLGPVGDPQSLADYTQTAIAQWGPVEQTINVPAGGQIYSVNKLAAEDPFTAMYQLPSGTIVCSNKTLPSLVQEIPDNSHPPIVSWAGNNEWDAVDIFQGEIVLNFVGTATEQAISQFLTANNLNVVFSGFVPNGLSGNECAWFQVKYNQTQFPTFDAAYAFFDQQPLVTSVEPSTAFDNVPNYDNPSGSGAVSPNDVLYGENPYTPGFVSTYPYHLGISSSELVPFGPESDTGGEWFSNSVVAVVDDGVFRSHQDIWVVISAMPDPYHLGKTGKASWVGVNFEHEAYYLGTKTEPGKWYGGPNPAFLETRPNDPGSPRLHTHGTRIAGMITGATNNTYGAVGCAPTILVLPIRAFQVQTGSNPPKYAFDGGTTRLAGKVLYDLFKPWNWLEQVNVTNMSYGHVGNPKASHRNMLATDQSHYNRLYVASAGNFPLDNGTDSGELFNYPAAYDVVLGVSGLWKDVYADSWYSYVTDPSTGIRYGSFYRNDGFATYEVSGIFSFTDVYRQYEIPVGQCTAPPPGIPPSNWEFYSSASYIHMNGTSACAPQVSALAALLFARHPERQHWQVRDRIVSTRHTYMEAGQERPIAGLVNYNGALNGW